MLKTTNFLNVALLAQNVKFFHLVRTPSIENCLRFLVSKPKLRRCCVACSTTMTNTMERVEVAEKNYTAIYTLGIGRSKQTNMQHHQHAHAKPAAGMNCLTDEA